MSDPRLPRGGKTLPGCRRSAERGAAAQGRVRRGRYGERPTAPGGRAQRNYGSLGDRGRGLQGDASRSPGYGCSVPHREQRRIRRPLPGSPTSWTDQSCAPGSGLCFTISRSVAESNSCIVFALRGRRGRRRAWGTGDLDALRRRAARGASAATETRHVACSPAQPSAQPISALGRGRGVDLRPVAGRRPQAHPAGQILHGVDRVGEVAAEAIELPEPQARRTSGQGAQVAVETRPVVAEAGGEVVVRVDRVVDTGRHRNRRLPSRA